MISSKKKKKDFIRHFRYNEDANTKVVFTEFHSLFKSHSENSRQESFRKFDSN